MMQERNDAWFSNKFYNIFHFFIFFAFFFKDIQNCISINYSYVGYNEIEYCSNFTNSIMVTFFTRIQATKISSQIKANMGTMEYILR